MKEKEIQEFTYSVLEKYQQPSFIQKSLESKFSFGVDSEWGVDFIRKGNEIIVKVLNNKPTKQSIDLSLKNYEDIVERYMKSKGFKTRILK